MTGAGISIECFPGRNRPVEIRSNRAVHAARVFEGKTPNEVEQLAPLLFSVCGRAQAVAAQHALAAADGLTLPADQAVLHAALVRIETAREHLMRALLDWPRFVVRDMPDPELALLGALLPDAEAALCEARENEAGRRAALAALFDRFDAVLTRDVLGISPADWLSLSAPEDLFTREPASTAVVPALLRYLEAAGLTAGCAVESDFLPTLSCASLEAALCDTPAERFVELPEWQGRARETSPLSRQRNVPIVAAAMRQGAAGLPARIVAAATELAATRRDVSAVMGGAVEPGIRSANVGADTGMALVAAARGCLVHRAELEGGVVRRYSVIAPTEWNFHPRGVVSRALGQLSTAGREAAHHQADLFVTLLDPCVAYSLEVH